MNNCDVISSGKLYIGVYEANHRAHNLTNVPLRGHMFSFQLILDAYDRTTLSPPLRSGTSPDQGNGIKINE